MLPIYWEHTTQDRFRGNAVLVSRKPSSWRDEGAGFIRTIIDMPGDKEGYAVMWKFQRWVVRFIDGEQEGHTTSVNIGYFYSYSFLDQGEEE